MFPSANIQDNLETSDVSKSEHFSVAASLLEVSFFIYEEIICSSALNNITFYCFCSLQVQKPTLATSLTHRSFMTNREMVTKPLSSEQAAHCRDAFVKVMKGQGQ